MSRYDHFDLVRDLTEEIHWLNDELLQARRLIQGLQAEVEYLKNELDGEKQ